MVKTLTLVDEIGRAVPELAAARSVWPRGERLAALRLGAAAFKRRFAEQGTVLGVRSFDIAAAPYPTRYAFDGATMSPGPFISIINRVLVVRYLDEAGASRVLLWEPTVPAGSNDAPFYGQLDAAMGRLPGGRWLSHHVFAHYFNTLAGALLEAGVDAADVDFLSFDHLHVQDPRRILALFPRAKLLAQGPELDTFDAIHPMQHVWYVDGGTTDLPPDRVVRLDGDVELGRGVALISTPGHTDGNHSLVLNTDSGVWVTSENGVAADNWQPELSAIPGVRRYSRFFGREIVPNANTLEDPLDQYDSMIVEKTIADPSARDPRWLQILPSSELAPWRRQWPVRPTFVHGGLRSGTLAG